MGHAAQMVHYRIIAHQKLFECSYMNNVISTLGEEW
uniref:Uncharacterized protein n=1 Tax=Anguilla anguilla TaxID=7936 RepID=A0A0E9T6D8_ANGAN